jgi:hypothetical protein
VGGQEQSIELRWTVQQQMPDAVVIWNLSVAKTTLAEGQTKLPGADGKATIKLVAPKVRAQTDLQFTYRIVQANADRELATGTTTVHVFPDQLNELAALTADTPLLVIDAAGALPAVLKAAGAKFDHNEDLSGLAATTQKIIVIGENRLSAEDPAAAALQALARGGASVLVLRQSAAVRVLQFERADRDVSGYTVADEHPLLRHLPVEAWKSFLAEPVRQPALAMPKDLAAVELVHGPVEAETVTSAPLDVLLMTQTLGAGRVVFCQLPLDQPAADARQQQLILNLIEYAQTRPQPTPSRAERSIVQKKSARDKKSNIYGE